MGALTAYSLELLIGKDEAARLMALPGEYRSHSALAMPTESGGAAEEEARPAQVAEAAAAMRTAALERKRAGDAPCRRA